MKDRNNNIYDAVNISNVLKTVLKQKTIKSAT